MRLHHTETIEVRVTMHEHALIARLAELRGASVSDVVRELIGLEPEGEIAQHPALKLVCA